MKLFKNKFEHSSIDESFFIEKAEKEIDILAMDLKNKNWTEIWDDLCHTELNSASITAKMSPEAQEKFKSLIAETKEVFAAEKENVDEDLIDDIQEALDKISEKL
jgi:ketopantoate reductase